MKIYMNNQVHPVLRDVINAFAVENLVPVRPMSEFDNQPTKTLPDANLEKAKSDAWDDEDFLSSDYCTECGGVGYVWLRHENPLADNEKEQCESCEDLHIAECRADNMMDAWKEGP